MRRVLRPVAIAAVIGLLMLAYCFPAAYVTIWPDTVRDFASSLLLARGEKIPLTGPGPINFGPYAGPAWIFLQAPPLVFFPSFVATSIYVALVASLKFPALYELGRRISSPRLGLCMAVAAAYPSFAVYQWIIFFHISWVEVMATATLILLLIADQRRSLAMLYAAIGMLGLAVQIHTTTLFYLPLAAIVLYRIGVRGPKMAAHLAVMVLLIAAWFIPVLFAPPEERGSLGGATHRIASDLSHFDPGMILVALRTAWVDYPIAIGEAYGGAARVPAWLWRAGLALVWLTAFAGALLRLRAPGSRRLFVLALGVLLIAWTAAVGVRSYTSFYLVYFLLPISALVVGLSLESTVTAPWRWLRGAGYATGALLVLSLAASAYGARSIGRAGLIDSWLLSIGDLVHPSHRSIRATYMSSAARDELALQACALPDSRIALHGELAYALSVSLGLDYRLHCPQSANRFVVFGTGPGAHLAALPEAVVPGLGIAQGKPARGVRLLTGIRPIYPVEGHAFEKRFTYFERLEDRRPRQRVVVEFEARPRELLAVYRHKPLDSTWDGFRVTREGVDAEPAFSTFDSWIYRAGDQAARWKVEVETDAPQWLEVFAIPG